MKGRRHVETRLPGQERLLPRDRPGRGPFLAQLSRASPGGPGGGAKVCPRTSCVKAEKGIFWVDRGGRGANPPVGCVSNKSNLPCSCSSGRMMRGEGFTEKGIGGEGVKLLPSAPCS